MTVCIAGIVQWKYPDKMGRAIVTASDRMLTVGASEYEPQQQKVGILRKHILIMVAGDLPHAAAGE
jgi:hypothetical protein